MSDLEYFKTKVMDKKQKIKQRQLKLQQCMMRRYMAKNKQEMKWAFSLFDQVHSKEMNPNLKYKLK